MTSPAASNSGFSALVAVGTALANTGNALTTSDITKATPALKAFFSGQKLTAGSSGWLASKVTQDPSSVDGVINYESVLMSMNTNALGEPLTLVTPSDGVISADYPFSVLNAASADKKAKADKLVAWLTTPEGQKAIMDATHRRPGVAGTDTGTRFPKGALIEQPFPNTLDVTNDLISTYLSTIRRPARTIYSLDVSGSMDGDRLNSLKAALKNLAGSDTSTTGSFASFQAREGVTLTPFSSQVGDSMRFTIPEQNKAAELGRISSAVDSLQAGGGTAIYSSLEQSYREAASQIADNPDTFTSIVLMTDGENNEGDDFAGFTRYYNSLSGPVKKVPVFVIIFGEGNPQELQSLAALTGGKAFDARKSDLNSVFREIRGYQ
jgi:Ca-activated chloride channel family protein